MLALLVLLWCSFSISDVHSFGLSGRLIVFRRSFHSKPLNSVDSRRSAQEDRRKMMEGVARGDSYEFEYDGVFTTYTPSVVPAAIEVPIQSADSAQLSTEFVANYGLESVITSRGLDKPLLPTEYSMAFEMFPRLRQAAIDKVWPDQASVTCDEHILDAIKRPTPCNDRSGDYLDKQVWHVVGALRDFGCCLHFEHGHSDGEFAISDLSQYTKDVLASRNFTVFINTFRAFEMDLNKHITELPLAYATLRNSENNSASVATSCVAVLDIHALIIDFLDDAILGSQVIEGTDYVQDIVLRLIIMALTILHAGLAPGQKATIYYSDFLTRRRTGL